MTKAKKQRIDTVKGAVEVMAKAATEILPPPSVPLEGRDLPFFANVIGEFARSEWTPHQLELAAMLARTMSDLEQEQRDMRREGSVAYSEKGTPVVNPRKAVIQMHAGTILSMRRSLSLHARAQAGEPRETGKRRAIAKEIESDNPLEDSLLARPN